MKKILYINSYTTSEGHHNSDVIGYGITSSQAICEGLAKQFDVFEIPNTVNKKQNTSLSWTLKSYQEILNFLTTTKPDLIFLFHIFHQFPTEIKRMLCALKLNVPIIGYTHGSHWDPTDTFRNYHFPGLKILDLANLTCLDSVLLASQQLKRILISELKLFNNDLLNGLINKFDVVGLPINTNLIDTCYTKEKFPVTTIVFNHSLISSKKPLTFFKIAHDVLIHFPNIHIIITRGSSAEGEILQQLNQLKNDYPKNIFVKNTLNLPDYYKTLWMSDIQVSTASHESLGVATLEAMYTQNCCILPNASSYPEISGGIYEHLYDDEESLFKKLCYFIENAPARNAIAQKLATAATYYAPQRIVNEIIKVIDKITLQA